MHILHIALQGCLRGRDVPYGLTADTGGHIKYLLELAGALDASRAIARQDIVVRRFDDDRLGAEYGERGETLSAKTSILRLAGRSTGYVPKEEMHGEIDALAANLHEYLVGLRRMPDVIHAHYADAGALALRMKRSLAIPYLFTAHSLGRVKSALDPQGADEASLRRRIATEDEVVAHADAVIASSQDEAVRQYGLYPRTRPDRISVNPPGCDLEAFGSMHSGSEKAVAQAVRPFLRNPELPPVLAISRPVRKKNLLGLVRAFGSDESLRRRANLIIFAGDRSDDTALDAEGREVITDLLCECDRFDLWGSVALPKSHWPQDVPAIYRFAAKRLGVFANPAFNEPFGLTLLEAAASGLPVVATRSGGPVDILARCENGRLVDPNDDAEIAAALSMLLGDRRLWEGAARSGMRASTFYSWTRHVERYLTDVRALIGRDQIRISTPLGRSPVSVRSGPEKGSEAG